MTELRLERLRYEDLRLHGELPGSKQPCTEKHCGPNLQQNSAGVALFPVACPLTATLWRETGRLSQTGGKKLTLRQENRTSGVPGGAAAHEWRPECQTSHAFSLGLLG